MPGLFLYSRLRPWALKWRKNCTLRRDFSHYCGGIPTLRRRRRRGGRLFLPLCFFGSTPSVSHAHCEATAAGSLQGCLRPRDPKSLAHASAPRCSFPTPKARGARFTFLYSFFSRPEGPFELVWEMDGQEMGWERGVLPLLSAEGPET